MANDRHRLVPDCAVSLAGQKLTGETDAALTKVEVDLDVDLFGECVLVFNDARLQLMTARLLAPGTAVKVEIGYAGKLETLFEGEVVALAPQFRRDLPVHLRVICQETLHRLALSSMTRSFANADDGEILKQVAREHGLSAEGPSGTKEHVFQQGTSDAVFLRRLAQKQGHHLRLEGKKLVMGDPPSGEAITIGPADGLRKVTVKIKAGTQVSEVVVHGYDPVTKREFSGKASGEGEAGEGAKKFGGSASLVFAGHEHQPADVATAEKMAKGRMRKLAEGHATARVEMGGNAALVPGALVTLDKIGALVDGTWRVEHARHEFSRFGFSTRFKAVRTAKKKPPPPVKVAAPPPPDTFLEIVLVDGGGQPLAGQRYKVQTADGRTLEGRLDASGTARLEGVKRGNNQVSFPDHSGEWRRV